MSRPPEPGNGGLEGEIVEPDGGVPAGAKPVPASRRRLGVVAAVLAVSLMGIGVLALRVSAPEQDVAQVPNDLPATAPSPVDTPTFGWTGIGEVRLGMSGQEYRELDLDEGGWDSSVRVSAIDDLAGCVQYEAVSRTQPTVWVWIRGEEVVSVGVDAVAPQPTAFGLRLGARVSRDDTLPETWWGVETARLPIARSVKDGIVAQVADTDLDGLLDYAAVSTAVGEACERRPPMTPVGGSLDGMAQAANRTAGASDIDGLTLDHVAAVGGIVSDVRPFPPEVAFGAARVQLPDGCAAEVNWERAPGTLATIDRPVWADFAMGPPVVTNVTVNLPC